MVSQPGIQPAPAQIHAALRSAILGLDLGPGERLSERGLEARFHISRTPVRAALLRLEGEELVRRDGRGWIVTPIDLGEIAALAEFREPLECAAVRLACTRAELADLDALATMMDECGTDSEAGAARARNGTASARISMSSWRGSPATRSSPRRSPAR